MQEKRTEIGNASTQTTQEIWIELQEMIPRAGNESVNFFSLSRKWGIHILKLKEAGFIRIDFRHEIHIEEEKRGMVYVEDAGCG